MSLVDQHTSTVGTYPRQRLVCHCDDGRVTSPFHLDWKWNGDELPIHRDANVKGLGVAGLLRDFLDDVLVFRDPGLAVPNGLAFEHNAGH